MAYLFTEDVGDMLGLAPRTVRERTRLKTIPHIKRGRRCVFRQDWIDAWLEGSPLEVVELPEGGRVVRPTVL